jgi:hypothetical protein
MSKGKLLNKSFKVDSATAKLLENMVAKSGTTQSDVMRHLITQANATEIASNINSARADIAVDMATGGVVSSKKNMGLGSALIISTGAGLAGYYATKEIRKQMGKEADFGTQYLIGILAGLGALGLLASVFGRRG